MEFDVIIVGSGPAGATTARFAAQNGLNVLLVDKKQELGAPIQCSGAVSAHALESCGIKPDAEFVSSPIHGFKIYDSMGRSTRLDYREIKPDPYQEIPLGYIVDRRRFDRYLMTQAEQAGAEVMLKTEATSFTVIDENRVEVNLKQFGQIKKIRARVIVGADGIQSQVGKWAGLQTSIKLSEMASCLQVIVSNVETEGLLELMTGHDVAPGGYAWIFPKGYGYAEIGLGVNRSMTKNDARWHLDHFIHHSFLKDRLKINRVIEFQGGGVPLAAPLKQQYADHLILVGDAARHVNPLTGGGIHTALHGGKIAGNFLGDLVKEQKPATVDHLKQYQERWMSELGTTMWRLYRLKRKIFGEQNITTRDDMLYKTLSNYFNPQSEFKKI